MHCTWMQYWCLWRSHYNTWLRMHSRRFRYSRLAAPWRRCWSASGCAKPILCMLCMLYLDLTRSLYASESAEQFLTRFFWILSIVKWIRRTLAVVGLFLVWEHYCIYICVTVSSTFRSTGTILPLESSINICHVVYACDMHASDVCLHARACGGPRSSRDSMCMEQWWWIHIRFARMNTQIQRRLL